jgi:hypothetical protein
VFHNPLGEHLACIIRRVLFEQAAQQIAATGHRKADRECELSAERAVIHVVDRVLVSFSDDMRGRCGGCQAEGAPGLAR